MSMGLNLVEASKLSQDMLQKGVIMTMATNSPVLEKIPFMEVVGNGYSYNLVDELPEVGFRQVNGGYTESGSTVSREVETLVILGGDVDVDLFIAKTRGNINDVRALQTELKAIATCKAFDKNFFNGDVKKDANSFDGLIKRLEKGKGTKIDRELSLDALNELLDAVEGGADVLYMDKATRREIMKLLQTSNHYIENGQDAFGRMVAKYGDVELRPLEDGLVPRGQVFAVKFGAEQYVSGLTNGGISVMDLGQLETKPCYRTRIEWYVSMAVFHPRAFAVLTGVEGTPTAKAKK